MCHMIYQTPATRCINDAKHNISNSVGYVDILIKVIVENSEGSMSATANRHKHSETDVKL